MAYGQTHTETLPTVSSTLGPTYATMINDCITEIRTTLNAKVTPAGIDVNADLSMRSGATRYGLTDIHRLSLYAQPSLLSAATYPAALYVSAAGELYYNDSSSNQIAITTGGSIAAAAGNITGAGYGTGGVELNWDNGASDYHFYSAASTYADVNVGDLLLSDGSGNFLRMAAAAMAADYTLTWPAALPALLNSVVMVNTSGTVTYTATPSVGTLTTSGLVTAGGGVTAGVNQDVAVSGTGQFSHGSITQLIPGCLGNWDGTLGSPPTLSRVGTFGEPKYNMSCSIFVPLLLDTNKRVVSLRVNKFHGATAGTRSFRFCKTETSTDNVTVIAFASSSATSNVVEADLELGSSGGGSTTLNESISSSYNYWLEITGESGDYLKSVRLVYDNP